MAYIQAQLPWSLKICFLIHNFIRRIAIRFPLNRAALLLPSNLWIYLKYLSNSKYWKSHQTYSDIVVASFESQAPLIIANLVLPFCSHPSCLPTRLLQSDFFHHTVSLTSVFDVVFDEDSNLFSPHRKRISFQLKP